MVVILLRQKRVVSSNEDFGDKKKALRQRGARKNSAEGSTRKIFKAFYSDIMKQELLLLNFLFHIHYITAVTFVLDTTSTETKALFY